MSISLDKEVLFWQKELVADYGLALALIKNDPSSLFSLPEEHQYTHSEVLDFLKCSTRGTLRQFTSKNEELVFVLLVGDYRIQFKVGLNNQNSKRLFPSNIRLLDHEDKRRAMVDGIIIDFHGVHIVSGTDYRSLEQQNSDFKSGVATDKLLALLNIKLIERAGNLSRQDSVEENNAKLTDTQLEMLECLHRFVDTEYELECQDQQLEPAFFYQHIKASPVKQSYRQFYDLTLVESDYERLLQKQPKLLSVSAESDNSDEILMEVVELESRSDQPVIQVSIERQVGAAQIPASGNLKLMALPTLQKIRNTIIEQLKSGDTENPWLLSLLSKEYSAPGFKAKRVAVDGGEFPPTESQQAAVDAGVATPDYSLVLGPPGTGKTTVILEWVRYFIANGQRVLVTSQNNKAVDNVLERLADEPQFECLRIGNETKVSSSLHDILLDNKATELQKKLFENSEQLQSYLCSAQSFFSYLHKYRQYVGDTINQHDEAQRREVSLSTRLETQSRQLDELLNEHKHLTKQVQLSRHKKQQRESQSPSFLLKLLTFGWHSYQLRRLERQINKWSQLLNFNQKQHDELSIESEQTEKQLKETLQKCAQYLERLQKVEAKHPGNYLDYIRIPDGRLLMKGKLSTYQEKISGIQTTLSNWFDDIHNRRRHSLYPLLLEHVNVVGATCIGINTKEMFRDIDFDVVIVDEAGQIQVHNLMVPLSRSKKAILVGDHKQIRPVVQPEVLEELQEKGCDDEELKLYERSWFELLWEQSPKSRKFMLDTQFRCPSEISDFVSQAFYENNYYAGANKINSKPLLHFCPSPIIWLDTAEVKNNHEERKEGQFSGNRSETNIIVEVCRRAIVEMPELVERREIGIIVPYRKHLQQIQSRIKQLQKTKAFPELSIPLSELVASVDSFQGQERELIIFACSRSNKRGNVGFLKEWQRINVALTRAKKQVIMVGNTETMTHLTKSNLDSADKDFKQAMQLLVKQLQERNAILPGFRFFPKKRTKTGA
ncbi:DEAD/DEAH box helicase [Idiomarina aminovorans]|uniref:DEAD/DEAH box helicase n=1 Tax=Idiomarina aminovorans TaxID=2914829 RepID=UPI0020060758|nr:AAA domain-containing protein [Idiomarina sp. ATCH4]MCK7460412.1 AAA domain-containing protein [Idiomarina sp. ATCH4]